MCYVVPGSSRLISSVVVECERGWVTFICQPGLIATTFGRYYVHRGLSADDAIAIRKLLNGRLVDEGADLLARYFSLPVGRKIRVEVPL